jgi:hypothetical protein
MARMPHEQLTERVLHAGFPIPASSLCAWATASVLGTSPLPPFFFFFRF